MACGALSFVPLLGRGCSTILNLRYILQIADWEFMFGFEDRFQTVKDRLDAIEGTVRSLEYVLWSFLEMCISANKVLNLIELEKVFSYV